MKRTDYSPSLRGQKWRDTHQATVDSILGPKVRTIRSQGTQFYNKDNWTARTFVGALCEWARLNKGNTPDRRDVEGWVFAANRNAISEWQKGIVIASTPDELPKGLSFALIGGAYHEAWHTMYSRRTAIHVDEVWPKVLQMWALIPYEPEKGKPGWSGLTGPLLEWSNIIEDIRIERLGCVKYPGSVAKMEALQDLILEQEETGRSASEHRGVPTNSDLSVVMGAFRDLGLGYQTGRQKGALKLYQGRSPGGWKFVNDGPLTPMLERSIKLSAEDGLGSFWLAMEVVAAIVSTVPDKKKEEKKEPEGGNSPEQGETPEPQPTQLAQPELPEEGEEEPPPVEAAAPPPSMTEDDLLKMTRILYKVGDRATLKSGPYAGRTVEVVRAGLPDQAGLQEIDFALVEEDGAQESV